MHVLFDARTVKITNQYGGTLIFQGRPFQRGYGFLSSLKSIFSYLAAHISSVAKAILPDVAEGASKVLQKVQSGVNIKDALRQETANLVSTGLHKAGQRVGQMGSGRKKRSLFTKKRAVGRLVSRKALADSVKHTDIFL